METDQLNATFGALSDPTRRAILERLAEGEASVGELAAPFDISLPAISRHLKVLERAQLIRRKPDAQWRRCRLEPTTFKLASDWIERYRQFWEDGLDSLAHYLDEIMEGEKEESHGNGRDKSKPRDGESG